MRERRFSFPIFPKVCSRIPRKFSGRARQNEYNKIKPSAGSYCGGCTFLWREPNRKTSVQQNRLAVPCPDLPVRDHDACSHRHDVRAGVLAGWEAGNADFYDPVFCCRGACGISEISSGWRGRYINRRTGKTGNEDFFKNMDATVKEMWLGASVWGAVCELASFWWVEDPLNVRWAC